MRILGIELGGWSVKAVEMESRFRKLEVLDFHEVRLPLESSDPTATYREAVAQLIASLPAHPEKIVSSIPAAQTALRFLQLPIKSQKKVEQTYRFELEDTLPFRMDDSIVEHYITRHAEGSVVFAAIALRRHVEAHLQWLSAIGLDPDWLSFDGMGLINLYLSAQKKYAEGGQTGPFLLVDIGHAKTNISVLNEDRLELFRSISWGGWYITQSISQRLNLTLEDAEKKKLHALRMDGNPDTLTDEETALVGATGEALSGFLADLSHCLVAYRASFRREVDSILLAGGTSRLKGLDSFLSLSLNKPASYFRPLGDFKLKQDLLPEQEARFGEALGLALVPARQSALLFDFRQGELAKQSSLTELSDLFSNPVVRRVVRFGSVLLGILFVYVVIAMPLAEKESQLAQDELKKVLAETFRDLPSKVRTGLSSDPKALAKLIDQKNRELDQKVKMLSKPRVPMTSLLKTISESFPAEIKVEVKSVSVTDRDFLVEGILFEGELKAVEERMKKSPHFQSIQLDLQGSQFKIRGAVVGRAS